MKKLGFLLTFCALIGLNCLFGEFAEAASIIVVTPEPPALSIMPPEIHSASPDLHLLED